MKMLMGLLISLCTLGSTGIAEAKYSCHADLKIHGLDGKTTTVRVTNNPLLTKDSSSALSMPSGIMLEAFQSYEVKGVQYKKYHLGMEFDLLQRVKASGRFEFLLHASSVSDPDPVYGRVFLMKKMKKLPGATSVSNRSKITLKTSRNKTMGEIFYTVDCSSRKQ